MKDHRPNKLNARAVSKVKQDWLTGVSLIDLAVEHDVSSKAIWYHVKDIARENGPQRGQRRSLDYARVVDLHLQGIPSAILAERFGVSRFHILRILRAARMKEKEAA